MPASRASTAACSLITPSCSHSVFAPMAIASCATPHAASELRKHPPYRLFREYPPAWHTLLPQQCFTRDFWRNRNHMVALFKQVFHYPISGRSGLSLAPTSAIVRVDVKTSAISVSFIIFLGLFCKVYDKPDIATIHPIPMYESKTPKYVYMLVNMI